MLNLKGFTVTQCGSEYVVTELSCVVVLHHLIYPRAGHTKNSLSKHAQLQGFTPLTGNVSVCTHRQRHHLFLRHLGRQSWSTCNF